MLSNNLKRISFVRHAGLDQVKPGNNNKKARTRSRDAGEKGLFRGMNGFGGSDMHPHAV
jgi:hypothetical protein